MYKKPRPGLVAYYNIWPANGLDLFLQPRGPDRSGCLKATSMNQIE